MPQSPVKTIIWAEFFTLRKSVLKWDSADFWKMFEGVQNLYVWDFDYVSEERGNI